MSTEVALNKTVEHTCKALELAQKNFLKSLGEYLVEKNIDLPAESKDEISKLFADNLKTYLMAEISAFLSFVIYDRLGNADVLVRFAPEFLDACEAQMGDVPTALVKKTEGLPGIAKGLLDSREEKGDITESLAHDLARMTQIKHLRASFDALLLYHLGE